MSTPVHPEEFDGFEPFSGRLELAPRVSVPAGVVRFAFSRSSGPGGQNVNKRSTKAELRVRPEELPLSESVRARLMEQARGYLTGDGDILIVADEHRTQSRNRDECVARLRALIVAAQVVPKVRRKTKPSRGSKERRLTAKKIRGQIKQNRRGGGD